MNHQGLARFSRIVSVIKQDPNVRNHPIIDVGANKGEWTRQLLSLFPEVSVLMIEANARHTDSLQSLNKPFQIALLAETEKVVPFYTAPQTEGTGDSMYRENTYHYDNATVSMCSTRTLDAVITGALPASPISLMKLDVQGAELDVLNGGLGALSRTDALIVETAMFSYNAGAPMFAQVVAFLEKKDFVVIDILELIEMPCKLTSQVDLLFARRGGFLHTYYTETIAASVRK